MNTRAVSKGAPSASTILIRRAAPLPAVWRSTWMRRSPRAASCRSCSRVSHQPLPATVPSAPAPQRSRRFFCMNQNYLDFEQSIADLEAKIEALRAAGSDRDLNLGDEINRLRAQSLKLTASMCTNLTPWQISQLARHPLRPYTLDYLGRVFTDFEELTGERAFAAHPAIVAGLARL